MFDREDDVWIRAGGPVDRVSISLRISDEGLDPAHITGLLNCPPDEAWRTGDRWTSGGRELTRRFGMWLIREESIPGAELEPAIHRLLDRLPSDPEIWSSVQPRYDVDLFCGIFLEEWNRGFELSPLLMRRVSERGLRIGFDIYSPADS